MHPGELVYLTGTLCSCTVPELIGLLLKCLLPDVVLYANLPPEDFNLLKVKECPYPAPVSTECLGSLLRVVSGSGT